MIPRHDEHRSVRAQRVEERLCLTELAAEVALREIPGDDHGIVAMRSNPPLHRVGVRGDCVPSKVDVGDLEELQDRRLETYALSRAITASVYCSVVAVPPTSPVTVFFSRNVASIAPRMVWARLPSPTWSSS